MESGSIRLTRVKLIQDWLSREEDLFQFNDAQWAKIEPLLPPHNPRGSGRKDDRRIPCGIMHVLVTGCRW